ncbi:MAG: hypothetical protein J5925_06940 [Clostridia bacterium]|nr:hypothetical protein [Clostridia bacterium]MBR4799807.1 hypothetical protein [Clostridia bacterium]
MEDVERRKVLRTHGKAGFLQVKNRWKNLWKTQKRCGKRIFPQKNIKTQKIFLKKEFVYEVHG